jgi:hypothetical protein
MIQRGLFFASPIRIPTIAEIIAREQINGAYFVGLGEPVVLYMDYPF